MSHRKRSKPCNVWSVVVKDVVSDFPGGTKKTGYCTCRAGSGGFFNHITAFSFQVESFLLHVKKPSKISQICKWNVPLGTKVDITPLTAQEVMFQNQHYTRVNERDLQKNKEPYMEFSTTLNLPPKSSSE